MLRALKYLTLALILPLSVQSQNQSNSPYGRVVQVGDTVWEWYNYAQTISEISDMERFRKTCLFPDTTVYVQNSTGVGKAWNHGFGQVLDPMAPLFSQTNRVLDTSVGYWVEKVSIAYRYFRPIDVQFDVLWVQFFNDDRLKKVEDPGWPSMASYATTDYDTSRNAHKGKYPSAEIPVFIDNDDTAGFSEIRNLEVELGGNGMYVEPGGKFAVAISYRNINPTSSGDTLDPYLYPSNKINAFIPYEVQDVESNVEEGFYNHGLLVNTGIRYNNDPEGWNLKYRPGTASASTVGIVHMDVSFLLRYYEEPNSIAELREGEFDFWLNPSDGQLHVESPSLSELQLLDLQGKVLMNTSLFAGETVLSLEELKSGMYLLHWSSQQSRTTQRLIKP